MTSYKEFRIGDLFDGKTGDVDLQNRDIDGKGEYFVNSGVQNQGVKGRTSRRARVFPAGTITVDFFGNAFLRDFEFKMATHNHVFALIEKVEIHHDAKLYIAATLNKLSAIHSFNNMLTWTILKDVRVTLPVSDSGRPDWEFMARRVRELEAERVRELEAERVRELEAYLIASGLNDYELTEEDKETLSLSQNATPDEATNPEVPAQHGQQLGEFKIGDLFEKLEVKKANKKELSKIRTDEYCVPAVYAKAGDNGIMYWGKRGAFTTYANVISIVYNGAIAAGLVYAQPDETGILAESYLIRLKNPEVPFEVNLYLKTAIEKVIYPQYSRDNLATWTGKVENNTIHLPITASGDPDWEFMARYVRAMKKLVIADVVKYKDEVLEATRAVVGGAG